MLLLVPMGAGSEAVAADQEDALTCRAASVVQVLDGGEGKCFTVTGTAQGGVLVEHGLHLYAQPWLYNDPSSSGLQLGLSDWEDDDAYAGALGAAHLKVTGVLRRCAEESGGNLLPEGAGSYCEGRRGLYLDVRQAEISGRAPIRRAVRADGVSLGNLVPLADSPLRERLLAEFRTIMTSHRADGGARLRLMLPQPRPDRFVGDAALAKDAAVEILGWRTPAWAGEDEAAGLHSQGGVMPEAIACVMDKERAAQNLWPISTRDIGIAAARPYICAHLSQHADGRISVEFRVDENPAVEG